MVYIILFGLLLRLSFLNKPEGLWNDEYVSWMVATSPFKDGFWQEVLKQCHMPLYYLYLKPFSHCSDLILRLTSVVPSVISIYVMYLVGKEYSKKTGIFAASITSILSFLIYYSQEVRFYSLLFLFTAISLLFTIRMVKNTSKTNIIGYVISGLLIIFTHVLGIIYFGFNTLYILYKKKTFTKKFSIGFLILCIILLPLFVGIYRQIPSSQWWGHFSYTNILFLFSDFLSPILTNNVNAPLVFFYNIHNALWLTVPTVIGILGMAFGIKNNKGITAIAFLTVAVMVFLALTGKIVFITKYSIEILPIFIVLLSCGFVRLNKSGLVLFALFISFHILAIFTPYYVTRTFCSEGHRIVGEILNARKPNNVLFTYYAPDRFYRYWKSESNAYYISKINRFEYKNNPERIIKNVKKGETLSVVFLDSVSFFPEEYMKIYTNLPEMFVTFSHIRNELTKTLDREYTDYIVDRIGSWTVVTAKKKY